MKKQNVNHQGPTLGVMERLVWAVLCAVLLGGQAAWAAPVADVSFPENDLKPFINEATTAEACIDNTGTAGSVGYQPVLELIVPAGYTVGSFSYLGTTVTPKEASGSPCATAGECMLNSPLQSVMPGRFRTIAEGKRYLTLEYPLGSFPDTQPKQCINFSLTPNAPTAVVGTPNDFNFTPIFTLGADPLNNPDPAIDPPIIGLEQNLKVTPQVIKHTKTIIAPEKETATGKNFIRTVELTVDVAKGETVSGITVTDVLPNSFQFVGITDLAGCTAAVTPSTTTPGGLLTFNCGAITGVVGVDKTIKFSFYVPEFDAGASPILNADNPGGGVSITNNSTASGTYGASLVSATDSDTITAKAHAIQKSVAVTDCSGNTISGRGPRPNDCLRYTIAGQISDYFRVDSAVLTDVLGDGQTFNSGFTPTWSVTQGGITTNPNPSNFTLATNFTAADKTAGKTTLTIDLSNAMGGGGSIIGDESDSAFNDQPATYQIVFESTIDKDYTGTVGGTKPLSAGDSVANTADVNSAVLDETAPHTATGGKATDGTEASVTIERPTLFTKSIYAVDGNTTLPSPLSIPPGQTVTYRIQYTMPFVSFEKLKLTDYLPIPKLLATEVTGFDAAAIPAAGKWGFGPTHTATDVTSGTAFSTDGTQNTLTWSFGDVETQAESQVIDILFTATMTTLAIADNLDLANLAQITSANSSATEASAASVVNIKTAEPILVVEKQVRNTGAGGSFADSVSNADAGDVIDYQITVTNTGNGPAYKIKLNDTAKLLSYFGSNCIAASVTGATGSGDLFSSTGALVLTELAAKAIATITYSCTIQASAVPNASDSLTNTATVTEYFSTAGSTNDLAGAGFSTLSDTATVGIQEIQSIAKAIKDSSLGGTTGGNINQGETLTFTITATLLEGTYSDFSLKDDKTTIPSPVTCGSDGFDCSSNVSVSGTTVTVAGTPGSTPGTISYTYTSDPLSATGSNTARVSATNAPEQTASANWTKVTPVWSLTKSMSPTSGAAGTSVTVTLKWRNTNSTSPMFGCVITDTLPTELFDVTSVAESVGGTPTGYTFALDGNKVTYTRTNKDTACETTDQTATFTVKVKDGVVTGSDYTNQAAATAKTLPGDDPNLVAHAGTVTGSSSAPFTVTAAAINAKVINQTSQNFTDPSDTNKNANPPVAIGERVTYDLTFSLPRGITNSVILADAITAGAIGDVALVEAFLARSNTSLTAGTDTGSGSNSINGAVVNTPVSVTLRTGTAGGCPADDQFCLALGDVNNSTSANASDTYTLTVTLRIANVANNTAGHPITDTGRIYYNNAAGTQQNVSSGTQTVTVAAPQVAIGKTASPASPSAGDTVTYVLTITNTAGANTATGFDWTFTDTLPADLINPSGIVTNAGSTGATVAASFTGNVLSGTVNQLDPGESVTITYTAQVNPNTPFGKTLTNAASTAATSLPLEDSSERTGAGGVNNLTASTTQPVMTSKPTLSKEVVDRQSYYAIGDIVHYRLTLGVPSGTTTNLTITDTLPAGLTFLTDAPNAPAITRDAGILTSFTYNGASPITFNLDTVTATSSGNIQIDYYAQVANVIANQNGQSRTNSASASYDKPGGGTLTSNAANEPSITIGEPNLTMTKTILSGATGSQAGDTVRYQFTVKNEGATTAYQMTVSDLLPAGINNITGVSVTPSGGNIQTNNAGCTSGSSVAPSDAVTSTTNSTNDTLTLTNLCIAPGATLTVVYDAVLMDSVQAGQTLTNPVRANYASQPTEASGTAVVRDNATNPGAVDDDANGDLNNYEESASNALTVAAPIAIDKQADKTQATIGETVTYTLKVSVIEGVTPSVVVTDVLPTGLSYVSHIISVGQLGMTLGNATYDIRQGTGQNVQFNLGNVSNPANASNADDFVTLAIVARVDNSAANQSGVVLNNGEGGTVTVQYGTTPTTVIYDYDPNVAGLQGRPLAITEPVLTMTKAANPTAQALGDVVTFTVNIENTGAATAFDLVIADTLPVGLTYVPDSASLPAPDVTAVGQSLTFRVSTLASGASTSFTYQARVDTSATVGLALTNSAALTWKSLSGATGAETNGRTGADGTSGLNDYTTSANAPVTPTTSAVIDAVKTVVDLNGDLVSSGDVLEYTVVLKNTGSSAVNNVIFTDPIPANTAYVGGSGTLNGGATGISFSDPTLTATVGTLITNATATIKFQVTINSGVPAGTVISNQGVVDSDQTVPEPTDVDGNDANGDQPTEVTVGQPVGGGGSLYAQKAVSPASVATGGQVIYTVTLTNTSAVALTNLQFSDTVPAQIAVTDATINPVATLSRTGQVVTATIANLAASASATITITGTAGATLGTFNNQGSVTYTDGATPRSTLTDFDGIPGNGNQPTPVTITSGNNPQLDVQKRWSLDTSVDGSGQPKVGDTLRYTLTIANVGAQSAADVRLNDPIPGDTTVVVGSVFTSQGTVLSESPVSVNIGSMAAGARVTVDFKVKIASAPASGVISNQATATRTGDATGVKSDDNGDSSDGLKPTLTPVYSGTVTPPALAKTVTTTSETGSSDPSVLIGEVLTFRLAFTAPPGTTPQLTFHDTLPMGLAYVRDSARLLRTSTALNASLNPGGINSTAADTPAILTDGVHLIQSGQSLTVALGDVTNSDATPRAYTLEYKARVQNIADNFEGRNPALSNSGTVSYRNALGIDQSLTPVVQTLSIIEPRLTLDKQVNPAALLSTGGATTYTLVVTNTGGGPAYDVCITDPLSAAWTLGTVTSTPSDANAPTGITLDAAACGSDRLRVQVAVFPVAGVLTISIPVSDTDLSNAANDQLNNTATTTWTSLPDATGSGSGLDAAGAAGSADGERTGAGSGVNTYTVSDSAQVTVNQLNLTKTVDSTIRYAIGDLVTYQLDVSVPAGYTVNNAVLTDQLPAGLVYVGPVSRTDNTATLTTASLTESASGDPETLTITLGTISNTAGTAQTLSLVYTVRVANVLGNQADTTPLNNIATLVFNDPGDNDAQKTRSANRSIQLGEPQLSLTLNAAGPGGGTLTGLQAGDEITYTLVLSNASGAGVTTAFDTLLSSALPAGLIGVPGKPTITDSSLGLDAAAILDALNVNGGGLSTAAGGFDLPPGSSITLTFKANLSAGVLTGDTILATPAEATYTSRNGDDPNERTGSGTPVVNDYRATANSQPITVNSQVAFDKQFLPDTKTSFAIGEEVTYRLKVSLIEGTTNDVVVTDTLPAGLSYVRYALGAGPTDSSMTIPFDPTTRPADLTITPATGPSATGQVVVFTLGDIVNNPNSSRTDDYLTIDLTARVDNVTGNQAATILGNNAQLEYVNAAGAQTLNFDANGDPGDGVQPLELTVIEPVITLDMTKSADTVSLGDTVTFTLTLSASDATAYGLQLVDTLPPGLEYVSATGLTPTVNGQILTFDLAQLAQSGSSVITITARMRPDAVVDQSQTNQAAVVWGSIPGATGAETNGRTGSGGINDYTTSANASVTPTTNAVITAAKTVVIATDVNNNGKADARDTLEYTIVLSNTGSSTVNNVVFTDPIPANTTYVGNSLTLNAISATNSGTATQLQLNIGSLATNATVTITFRVTINSGVPAGTVISNQGSVDSNETVPTPTNRADVRVGGDLAAGALYAQKTVAKVGGTGIIGNGDTVEYTLTLRNTGNARLTKVSLIDALPTGLSYVDPSAATATGRLTVVNGFITWTVGNLAASTTITATFRATVSGVANNSSRNFSNQATVTYTDPANKPQVTATDSNGAPSDGNQPTVFTAVNGDPPQTRIEVQKRWGLAIDADGNGLPSVGDTLRYTLIVTNSSTALASDVRLTDAIPANTTVVAGSVATSQGAVVGSNPVEVNLGNLAAGQTATVSFEVTINAGVETNTVISNQASVATTGLGQPVQSNITLTTVINRQHQGPASIPTLSPVALLGFITMLLWLLRSTTRARCAPSGGKRRDG